MSSPEPPAEAARPGQSFYRMFAYYAMFVCLGLDVGVLGPTLPSLARQTGAGLGPMGLLFLFGSIGGALGTAISGRVFERKGGHIVLGIAQLCAAALVALIPSARQFWLLALIVGCRGVTHGFINTGANTLLVWTHGDRSGPYMNALHFAFGLGAFVGPLVVAQLIGTSTGYPAAYWGLGAFAALVGLRVLTLPGSPQPVSGKTATGSGSQRGLTTYLFVLASALFLFFYVSAEISFGGWVYTYALSLKLATEAGAAYLTSAFWLSFTVGRLVSIGVAVRIKPGTLLPVALVGCLACLAVVLILPGSIVALWAAAIGLGFLMAPIWPTAFTLAGQSMELSGRMSGLVLLGDSFGGMVLPSVIGKVIEVAGPRAMVYLIFASLVCNFVALAAMFRLSPRRRHPAGGRIPS